MDVMASYSSFHAVGCSQVVDRRVYSGLVEELVDRSRNESPDPPSRVEFQYVHLSLETDTGLEELISMGDGDWEN